MTVTLKQRTDAKGGVQKYYYVQINFSPPTGPRIRYRKKLFNSTRRDAEQFERNCWSEILRGEFGRKEEQPVPTLNDFVSDFMKHYVKVHNKPSEQRNKEMHLRRHLLPFFGKMKLDAITGRTVDRYIAHKFTTHLKAKTINLHVSTLRRALSLALEWEIITVLPRFRFLKVPKYERDFLDFDEAARLIDAADPEYKTMTIVALRTGMRLGELLGLRWRDVDLVTGRLVVNQNLVRGIVGTPKSGKSREIPLSDEALTALKQHRHLRGELVFCTDSGKELTKDMIKRAFERAAKRAGLRHVYPHMLRHSFASHLAMRGAPQKAIQDLMGHSTAEMTNRYMHLSPDARRDAVQLLDNFSRANGTSASSGDERQ